MTHPEIIEELKLSLDKSFEDFLGYSNDDESEELIQGFRDNVNEALSVSRYKRMNISWIFGSLLSLIGVMLMWRMRKVGFHFYIGGNLVMIFAALMVFNAGFVAWMFASTHIFFGAVFTLLYALNLKVLK